MPYDSIDDGVDILLEPNKNRSAHFLEVSLWLRKIRGSILGPVRSDTVSTPLWRFCVAQALSRGDGSCHSLHVSA